MSGYSNPQSTSVVGGAHFLYQFALLYLLHVQGYPIYSSTVHFEC